MINRSRSGDAARRTDMISIIDKRGCCPFAGRYAADSREVSDFPVHLLRCDDKCGITGLIIKPTL